MKSKFGRNALWRRIAMALLMGMIAMSLAACESDDDDDDDTTEPDDTADAHGCVLTDAHTEDVAENQICYVSGDNEPVVIESGVDGAAIEAVYNTEDEETTIESALDDAINDSNVAIYIGGDTADEYSSDDETTNFELYIGCDDAESEDAQCTSTAIPNVYSIYTVSDCSEDDVDSSLTVTVDEFGDVGEQVRGTFEGTLVEYTFFPDHSIVCSNNGTISGAFSIERGDDVTP